MIEISIGIDDDNVFGCKGKVFTLNSEYTKEERQDLINEVRAYLEDKLNRV